MEENRGLKIPAITELLVCSPMLQSFDSHERKVFSRCQPLSDCNGVRFLCTTLTVSHINQSSHYYPNGKKNANYIA